MLRRINLIPQSERARTQSDAGMLALIIVGAVVLAAIAFTYVYYNGVLKDRQQELASLQSQTAQVQNQLNALAEYQALDVKRQNAEAVVQHIYSGRTLVSQTLGDLSLVIPKESWLQQMQVSSPAVPAYGAGGDDQDLKAGTFSVSGQTYTFEDVATTMVRLEQIPSLGPVLLTTAGTNDPATSTAKSIKTFTLTASVSNTQPADTPLPISQVQVSQ